MTYCRLKHFTEPIAGAAAALVLGPLMAMISIAIWVTMGHPVLFRQRRIGYGNREFTVQKFRSMIDVRDAGGSLLPDDVRLGGIGKLLRATSVDELPQLWNVMKGEMSIVGPRPLLPEYLERYSLRQLRRHEVRPGITGWAQVNGRNALSWEEKFELDVWYVENQSFLLDLKILWMTVVQVLRRRGVSAEGHATMPEFLGLDSNGEGSPEEGTINVSASPIAVKEETE